MTMEGDNDAPTTHATIANVVTAPSVAPYTKSSIVHFKIIFYIFSRPYNTIWIVHAKIYIILDFQNAFR